MNIKFNSAKEAIEFLAEEAKALGNDIEITMIQNFLKKRGFEVTDAWVAQVARESHGVRVVSAVRPWQEETAERSDLDIQAAFNLLDSGIYDYVNLFDACVECRRNTSVGHPDKLFVDRIPCNKDHYVYEGDELIATVEVDGYICRECEAEFAEEYAEADAESALENLSHFTSRGDNEKYDADEDTLVSIEQELDSAIGVVEDYINDGMYTTDMDNIKATDAVRAGRAVQEDLLDRIEADSSEETDAIAYYENLIEKAKELLAKVTATYEDAFLLFEKVSDAMGTVVYIAEDNEDASVEAATSAQDVLNRTDKVVTALEDRMNELEEAYLIAQDNEHVANDPISNLENAYYWCEDLWEDLEDAKDEDIRNGLKEIGDAYDKVMEAGGFTNETAPWLKVRVETMIADMVDELENR